MTSVEAAAHNNAGKLLSLHKIADGWMWIFFNCLLERISMI